MSASSEKPVSINITNRTLLRIVIIIAVAVVLFNLITAASHVIILIITSFFLAIALNPAVSLLIRHLKLKSRTVAAALAYLVILAILALLFFITVPPLIRQITNFVNQLPSTIHNFSSENSTFGRFLQTHNLNSQLDIITNNLRSRLLRLHAPALNTAANIGSTLLSVITVLVMTFMMIVEAPYWAERLWQFYPASLRVQHKKVASDMYGVVTGYVNGQLLLAVIAAVFALLMLLFTSSIMHVSINAVGLAGVVGIIGLIPMIGNTIAAVIVVMVCLLTSLPLAIVMALFFLVYQQVENATLQPFVQSKFNELTPLLVFIAAILGIGFGGLLGAFIAIPLAGCLKIAYNEFVRQRKAGSYEN